MEKKKTLWNPVTFILIVSLAIILYATFFFTPAYYNWIYGESVIDKHLEEVLGKERDPDEVAILLMDWVHKNVKYPVLEDRKFHFGIRDGSGLYEIDNRSYFFLRNGGAAWTIKTKVARCGEDARYFVEIMEKLGVDARIVKAPRVEWDHAWVEYYNAEGYKILVDPSSNQVISDPKIWIAEKNITKIESIDLQGNVKDVTEDYR